MFDKYLYSLENTLRKPRPHKCSKVNNTFVQDVYRWQQLKLHILSLSLFHPESHKLSSLPTSTNVKLLFLSILQRKS